jgi:hypothetical protein
MAACDHATDRRPANDPGVLLKQYVLALARTDTLPHPTLLTVLAMNPLMPAA